MERGDACGARSLWTPPADARATTRIGAFLDWLAETRDLAVRRLRRPLAVVGRRPRRRSGLRAPSGRACAGTTQPSAALGRRGDARRGVVPRRHAQLRRARARGGVDAARRGRDRRAAARPATPAELTWAELADAVARCRAGLVRLGVQRGDRVAAYLPNIPETIVAFLATASLGAVWSSCAPEFGTRSVVDRFAQIEPTVLLAVDGYRYGDEGRRQARRGRGDRGRAADAAPHRARAVPRRRAPTTGAALLAERRSARVRPGAVRPPALRALQLGHDRAARRRSCTATAASPSSTSRRSRCTTTSAPATASSGSPPPAG